ncbi:MAG: hypothetical protein N4A72_20980 [Bacteroidales bacterium]|jgi:hypothetical protein|nr:hypothetical protein [Bacteroidales bacterium]
MIKKILPFVFIVVLMSCNADNLTVDYFGQEEPGNTPEIFAKDIISVKGRFEHGISFTPNSQELAFGIFNKGDFSGTIYYSKKSRDRWTTPGVFEPLRDESAFLPYFSPDGAYLLYAQSRPDTSNYLTDIWMLKRGDNQWEQPEKVKSPVSTLTRESTACLTLNNTIYFSSNRDGNGLADLYCTSLNKGEYRDAKRLDSICTVRDEESIFVAPDESYIIFSRYATNENGPDLFISYRDFKGNWAKPTLLDSAINTTDWERRPFVSVDNKFLFFTKQIFDDKGYAESDIYWVNTNKVFKPFVFKPILPKIVKVGEEMILPIPADYFKDIDSEELSILFNNRGFDWAKFNSEKMILTLTPDEAGEFDMIFTAIDDFSNKTVDNIKVIVKE